jgi:hypothetical protein
MGRECNMHGSGEERNAYSVLVEKAEGKRPLVRSRPRFVDNIKIYHREVGCSGVDWIDLVQDRNNWWNLVSTLMNLWVP